MRAGLLVGLGLLALGGCVASHQVGPAAHPPALRVVVPRNVPPYAFRRGGKVVGLEVDFAIELAAALGRPLDLLEVDFNELIAAVRAGHADVGMAGMTITRAREVVIAFSDPYLRSGLLAVMRREDASRFKTVASVLGTTKAVGVVEGTTGERFVREHLPNATPTVYPATQDAMDELRQGRVTFVIHDAPVAIWYAGGDEANLAVVLQLLGDEEQLGWGLPLGDETLRSAVNGALARWRTDGTRDRILARWVPYWQRLETAPAHR